MTGAPTFVLSGPGGTLVAEGTHTAYRDVAAARAALRRGDTPIIMGALPFDVASRTALVRPQSYTFGGALPSWPIRPLPRVRVAATIPAPGEHQARIRRAMAALRNPNTGLRKVVLARALDLVADNALDVPTLLTRLAAADPGGYVYGADLSPAGARYTGSALVGASPELLVARTGERVVCQPFAGSAPRSDHPDTDRGNGAALAASAKNRLEHALVIDAMRKALDPLCVDLQVAPTPQLSRTAALWHLSTPITARLRQNSTSALDLALALHPTPAVGGVPTEHAVAMIAGLEGDRGFYAGATGWCDRHGDGRWVVSIRCAQLSADRRRARAYSGGGIVADSDVGDELAETTIKFKTILAALGVPT
ncbi:MAG: isochorismate synthase [Mycobacteriaceae bacterium]|nr:isochorismate synthase [Mycobacteriaceae bacterium]MBV9641218.1 isochorismate synthase [Mycobacteriaceae bacterium]